jgi:hypothetical protein
MFSGGFLLSHNAVHESCYESQLVTVLRLKKISPLNVVYSKIQYENYDIF